MSPVGWIRMVYDFITLLRTAHNLNLMICFYFWNFPLNIFGHDYSGYLKPWTREDNYCTCVLL
jgi:hypothetical protein